MAMPPLEQLMALPREVQAQIPLAPPPPGVIPNFDNAETLTPLVWGINFTFMAIATIFCGLRGYMNICVLKRWRAEDTLIISSYCIAIVFMTACALAMYRGSQGKHTWEIHLDRFFFEGWLFSAWTTNTLSLVPVGLAKIAILLQYWRLFSPIRWMRICIYIGLTSMILFYFGMTIVFIVLGSPWPGEGPIAIINTGHAQYLGKMIPPAGIVSTLFDWYVLLLPIPAVARLKLSTSKKLGIITIFATGGLACIASIISCYYRYHFDANDMMWGLGYLILWVQMEMWTAIIAACMPTVHQFWHRQSKLVWFSDLFKSSIRSLVVPRSRSGQSGSGKASGGSAGPSTRRVQHDREKEQSDEDRQRMVRIPSHGRERGSDSDIDDIEMARVEYVGVNGKTKDKREQRIQVVHSYSVEED